MTFDGGWVVATEHGWIVAVSRDFTEHHVVQLRHANERVDGGEESFGWIRNGLAIDSGGGIYVASQHHLHKVLWTGSALSIDEGAGAWAARYPNSTGSGMGATPTLMGFGGEEDHLVVISDGEKVMNVTVFWCDEIPADWPGLNGKSERRMAGRARADLGGCVLWTPFGQSEAPRSWRVSLKKGQVARDTECRVSGCHRRQRSRRPEWARYIRGS
jgi:hypothetical protein